MTTRVPDIIIPYMPTCGEGDCEDIFVYLRPETNGIKVESLLLQVIQNTSEFRDNIELIYLANIPGDFISRNKIVEKHYSCRLSFAVNGLKLFTPSMKEKFELVFGEPANRAHIIGSFDALKELSMTKDELFKIWVPMENMASINGQIIKKYQDHYIVNYDIPEIIHKNNASTDIAVMLFRTPPDYILFSAMITEMEKKLREQKIISSKVPPSHAFHYSKGPFEQLLDARGYLYKQDDQIWPIENIGFGTYLEERGFSDLVMNALLDNPIMLFDDPDQGLIEMNIMDYTARQSYSQAFTALERMRAQIIIQ